MAIVVIPDFENAVPAPCDESPRSVVKGHAGDGGLVVSLTILKDGSTCLKVPQLHHLQKHAWSKTCMVTTWVTVKKYSHCPGQSLTRMARPGCQFQCSAVPFLLIYLHIKGSSLSVPLLTIPFRFTVPSTSVFRFTADHSVPSTSVFRFTADHSVPSTSVFRFTADHSVPSTSVFRFTADHSVPSTSVFRFTADHSVHQPVCSGLLMPLQSEWIISLTAF